jgi:hypothetical protein
MKLVFICQLEGNKLNFKYLYGIILFELEAKVLKMNPGNAWKIHYFTPGLRNMENR